MSSVPSHTLSCMAVPENTHRQKKVFHKHWHCFYMICHFNAFILLFAFFFILFNDTCQKVIIFNLSFSVFPLRLSIANMSSLRERIKK